MVAGFLELKAKDISCSAWEIRRDLMSDDVQIFLAEKWVVSVVFVERHSERVLILKMISDNGLLNVLMAYAPHSGKPVEEIREFLERIVPFSELYTSE